jgi:1-acyl-sn-glycerol-3-phosphate acyltransferase
MPANRIVEASDRERIMNRIRRLAAWSYGCYAWLVFGLLLLLFGSLIIAAGRPALARPLARIATRIMFFLADIPLSAHGLNRLPGQPHILLVNHTSFLDGLVLSAMLPPRPGYAFTVKQQYRSQALLWPLLKALGVIVFRHGEPAHHSSNLALLAAALERGENLVVFPEGGIAPQAGLQPFHSGAFIVATTKETPLVIAGMQGAREALRLGTWLPRHVAITLKIGAVLMPEAIVAQSTQQLIDAAHAAMQPLTGEGSSAG